MSSRCIAIGWGTWHCLTICRPDNSASSAQRTLRWFCRPRVPMRAEHPTEGLPVIPWILLDSAPVPGGNGELRLLRRGAEFSIRLGRDELMNSRLGGSEEALASVACERVRTRKAPRILIGGLGMGFTLRAALAALGPDARIAVAELVPAVIKWARGPMAAIFGDSLDDPRVSVREVDVAEMIKSPPRTFDAILLDVDNGPEGLTRQANDALYGAAGLRVAYAALRP